MFTNKKRAFTLIEMLIVIVIIGILAAALIPRLSNARGRANDTARKADLQQTATTLSAYIVDKGSVLVDSGSLNFATIAKALTGAGMSSIPKDPVSTMKITGVSVGTGTLADGQYAYTSVKKAGVDNAGFVVMARSETEGGSNWVVTGASAAVTGVGWITQSSTVEGIVPCTTLSTSTTVSNSNGTCTYVDASNLRYIVVY